MVKSRVKVATILESQLPEFIREEYPLASEFLSQYYTAVEHQGAPLDLLSNIDQYIKLDNVTGLAKTTSLTSSIEFYDKTIKVDSTEGFSKQHGLLQIGEEIITYTGITTNSFTGCIRGFVGITSFRNSLKPEDLVFSETNATGHNSNSVVRNLNTLFLEEFLLKLKRQFAPGFDGRTLVSNLNENIFVKQARDFYSSKGTDESFKILFKALYGEEIEIVKPRDYLFQASDARFKSTKDLVVEAIVGDPRDLVNKTLTQEETDYSTKAYGSVVDVERLFKNNREYYKIKLDYEYDKDIALSGSIFGTFTIHPKTKIINTEDIESGATTISVDSTVGFPNSGELLLKIFLYDDNQLASIVEIPFTYTGKTINQFLGCQGLPEILTKNKYELRINDYAYGLSDNGDQIRVRVSGVLSDLNIQTNTYLCESGDDINIISLGKEGTTSRENNWVYNIPVTYAVKSIVVTSSDPTYRITTFDNHTISRFDSVILESADGVKKIAKVLKVSKDDSFIIGEQGTLNLNTSYIVTRRIAKVNTLKSPESNVYNANIQNVYFGDDAEIYVASTSLPNYQEGVDIRDLSKTFNGSFRSTELIEIGPNSFYTGDSVVYRPGPEGNRLDLAEGVYFVKKVDDKNIKLSRSRSNIYTESFVKVSGNLTGNQNKFEYFDFSYQKLESQNIIRKIGNIVNDSKTHKTESGFVGILKNGVEILNYKSKDSIFYGPIESIEVLSDGSGYDVINPPILQISDPTGTGCTGYCAVTGQLERVDILDRGFDYLENPTITISGGDGSGARISANLISIDHEVVFNATEKGGLIDVANSIIGFSTDHKFRNGEKVFYYTNNQRSIAGLTTDASYYVSIVDPKKVRLYKEKNDAVLSNSDYVGIGATLGIGNHVLKSSIKKKIIGSVNIISPGSGYKNNKTAVDTADTRNFNDIIVSLDTLKIRNHGYSSGDIIVYDPPSQPIGGLGATSYYVTKVDSNNFKLSQIGSPGQENSFYKTKQYVNLTSKGVGIHTFNYQPIAIKISGRLGIGTTGNDNYQAVLRPVFRGSITSVNVVDVGSGYGSPDIINFNKQPIFDLIRGSSAQLVPIVSDGIIKDVLINYSGSNYNSTPNIIIEGSGSGAILVPIIQDGILVDIKVINGGYGYSQKDTKVIAIEAGFEAEFAAKIKQWNINTFERLSRTNELTLDDGVISNGLNPNYGLQYSHVYIPRALRRILNAVTVNEDGNNTYRPDIESDTDPVLRYHSPIIGWAYDGNPIYGPYGYSSIAGGPVVRMKSGYILDLDPDRPSNFPAGFFVEDYVYNATNGNNEQYLDQHNGRYCATPDFPNGTYAYFATISDESIETDGPFRNQRKPIFPYLVGDSYKSKPDLFNFKKESNQNDLDLNDTNWTRNTYAYNFAKSRTFYNFLENPLSDGNFINAEVKSIGRGFVSGLEIVNAGKNYQPRDQIVFNNENTFGSNAFAKVESVFGVGISTISTASTTINNVEFVAYGNKGNFIAISSIPHGYINREYVTISGLSTDGTEIKGFYTAKVDTTYYSLKVGIETSTTTGIVTYISIAGPLDYPYIEENDILEIEDELVKVLNIDPGSSRIRVLRRYDNSAGVAHSASLNFSDRPRRFVINSGFTTTFEYVRNRQFYFDPRESVGLGTTSGVGISSALFFGLDNLNVPVGIATSSSTILYFKNDFDIYKFNAGGYIEITNSTTSTGIASTAFHKQHLKITSIGSTSITVNFNSTTLQGVGVTAYIGKEKSIEIPTKSIYIPNHNLKTGTRLEYSSNGGSSLTVSIDGTSTSLTNFPSLYAIKVDNDTIGISTVRVGYGSTGIISGIGSTSSTTPQISFIGFGTGVYHSFKTKYDNIVLGDSTINRVTVSTGETHGLQVGNYINMSVVSTATTVITVQYNDENRRIVLNPKSFVAANINTQESSIQINDHGLYDGQKVIYTPSNPLTPIGGLTNNGIYYIISINNNNFKLASSKSDALKKIPLYINLTSSSDGTIYQINPRIRVQKNQKIEFDLSSSTLSYNFKSAFNFSLYKDKNFKHIFKSDEKDTVFEVSYSGIIGISPTAKASLIITDNLPRKLYYNLNPIDIVTLSDVKKEIIIDSEVEDRNAIEIVSSKYNGEYPVIGVTTNKFVYPIPEKPEKMGYLNLIDCESKYSTKSTNVYGPIATININSKGQGYKYIPGVSSIISDYGSQAVLRVKTNNIGRVKTVKINNIGFDYPSDKTLGPTAKLPQILKVGVLSIIDRIGISSGGKNYIKNPKLIVLDGLTLKPVKDIDLSYKVGSPTAKIIKNTDGINNVTPLIIPTKNPNGVKINYITFDSPTGIATAGIAVSYSDAKDFPFNVGDRILIENTQVISKSGKGFNSKDYNYRLFNIVSTDPNIGGENGSITYDMSSILQDGYLPGTYDTINSIGTIVPEKYFPKFKITLKQKDFRTGETIKFGSKTAKVERWDDQNNYLKISGNQSFSTGDLIFGRSSRTKAIVEDVISFDSQYNIDSYSISPAGFFRETGFLNDNLQRLHDNDYYQYFSYAISSKIPMDVWEEPVSTLNHTSGFKKFSDLKVESYDSTYAGITTSQDEGSFFGINDITRTVNINCINDFDLASENSILIDSELVSNQIIFATRIIQDYSEALTNRVLVIDDISNQFTSENEDITYSVADTVADIFDFTSKVSQKYLTFVKDKRFVEKRQLSNVTLIQDNLSGYINEYGKVYTDEDLGSFDINTYYNTSDIVFVPNESKENSYSVDILSFNPSYTESVSGISSLNIGSKVNIKSNKLTYNGLGEKTIVGIASTYCSAKILVEIANSKNEIEFNELSLVHNGSTVSLLEYGKLNNSRSYSTGIGTYGAELVSNNIKVNFYPNSTGIGTVKVLSVSIANTSTSGVSTYKLSNSILNTNTIGIASTSSPGITTIASYNHLYYGENYSGSYYILSVSDKVNNRHQISEVVVIDDGSDAVFVEYANNSTSSGLGTVGVGVTNSTTNLYYTPISNTELQVTVFQSAIGVKNEVITTQKIDFSQGSLKVLSSSYTGSEILDFKYDLYHKNLPIFEREFDASDSSIISISNNSIKLLNHFFVSGEEVNYSIADPTIESPVGIATTSIVGIGSTNKLPSTLYTVKVSNSEIKLASSAQNALTDPPECLIITSLGVGKRHKLTAKNQISKSLITIDGIIQSPITNSYIKTSLSTSITTYSNVIKVSGIGSLASGDLIKIDNEIMKVKNVGTANTVTVYRSRLGTELSSHSIGTSVTKLYGNYDIINNSIYFVDRPYGTTPVGLPTSKPDQRDYSGITTQSYFSGRVFTRSGVPDSNQKAYSDNFVYDDISNQFNGFTTSFALKSNGSNPTGIQTYNPIVLIKGVFQNNERSGTAVDVTGNFKLDDSSGISTITFFGYSGIQTSDINVSNIPIGGVIVSVGSSQGFGYQPLVAAGATVRVSLAGTISAISIGNSGSGYRSGIQTAVTIYARNSGNISYGSTIIGFGTVYQGNIANPVLTNSGIGFTNYVTTRTSYASASVSAGSTIVYSANLSFVSAGDYASVGSALTNVKIVGINTGFFTIGSASTSSVGINTYDAITFKQYSPPTITIDRPIGYINIPLKYTAGTTGLGTGASIDVVVGQGSSVIDFTIKNYGFGYKPGDILTADTSSIGIQTIRSSSQFREFYLFVENVYFNEFSAWSFGELQIIDDIAPNFNGRRKIFNISIDGKITSITTKKGSNIDIQSNLIIFVNDILQNPGESYFFDGGSTIEFSDPPKGPDASGQGGDTCKIFYYRGTKDVDVIDADILETVKIGDDLTLTSDDEKYQQEERSVILVDSTSSVITNAYSENGVSEDPKLKRPVIWCKQTEDKIIEGKEVGKDRVLYEALINPVATVIRSVGINTTQIFVDSIKPFFNDKKENIGNKLSSKIEIYDNIDNFVSAAATCIVSAAGTIQSLVLNSGGNGYTNAPTITFTEPYGIGNTGRASATASITSGVVTSITIDNPGIGYSLGRLQNVSISSTFFGSGFPEKTATYSNLRLSSLTGEGRDATVTLSVVNDRVNQISVSEQGTGYKVGDLLTVTSIDAETEVKNLDLEVILNVVSIESPTVFIDPPNIENVEKIDNVTYEGDFGIITGIKTTSIGTDKGLIFDLFIPYNSTIRNANVNVGLGTTGFSGIQTGYFFVAYNTNVGNAITSYGLNGSSVGVGTTFIDNIYQAVSVSYGSTSAIGVGLTNLVSVTVKVSNNNITGLGYSSYYGNYSWGKITTTGKNTKSFVVQTNNGITGLSTCPVVRRRYPLKYELYAL